MLPSRLMQFIDKMSISPSPSCAKLSHKRFSCHKKKKTMFLPDILYCLASHIRSCITFNAYRVSVQIHNILPVDDGTSGKEAANLRDLPIMATTLNSCFKYGFVSFILSHCPHCHGSVFRPGANKNLVTQQPAAATYGRHMPKKDPSCLTLQARLSLSALHLLVAEELPHSNGTAHLSLYTSVSSCFALTLPH